MKLLILTLPILFATAAQSIPSVDESGQEALTVVKTAVNAVIKVLKDEELSRVEKRESSMEIVEPLIDFRLLGYLSLGKTQWSRIDAAQRDSFTELFSETLKLSYFEKLELFTDEAVEFEEPVLITSKGSPKYFIVSYIVSKGDRVKVGYQMAKRDDAWKVFDFEIEGVSIRKSYGSQYTDFLREGSFDSLLKTMKEKIETEKESDSESVSGIAK